MGVAPASWVREGSTHEEPTPQREAEATQSLPWRDAPSRGPTSKVRGVGVASGYKKQTEAESESHMDIPPHEAMRWSADGKGLQGPMGKAAKLNSCGACATVMGRERLPWVAETRGQQANVDDGTCRLGSESGSSGGRCGVKGPLIFGDCISVAVRDVSQAALSRENEGGQARAGSNQGCMWRQLQTTWVRSIGCLRRWVQGTKAAMGGASPQPFNNALFNALFSQGPLWRTHRTRPHNENNQGDSRRHSGPQVGAGCEIWKRRRPSGALQAYEQSMGPVPV